MAEHNELGRMGESMAVEYLAKEGYDIIKRNFRFNKIEVDIIAMQNDLLIAFEVKTRSTKDYGDPQGFVKPDQIKRLVKAMDHFVESNGLDVEVRFDIIALVKQQNGFELEHLKNAFYHF